MIQYEHVVEIGAGDSYSSQGWPLSVHAAKVTLWEPNSILCADLRAETRIVDNVIVREAAVCSVGGQFPLYHLGYASYLAGQPSFFATSIEPEGEVFLAPLHRVVETVAVGQAVTKDVDYLILTVGGGEHRLLRAMTARPKTVETKHYCHRPEQWAEAQKVFEWMSHNGYEGRELARNQHSTFIHARWVKA